MIHTMLTCRTDFSIGEATMSIEKLVESATALGQSHCAITDIMSITAMIEFTNKCKKVNIKPIIGCRLRLVNDIAWRKTKEQKSEKHYFVTVWAMKEAGMKSIFRLLTKAASAENFYFVPRLTFSDLVKDLATLSPGDIAVGTGDLFGLGTHPQADKIAAAIAKVVPDHFYAQFVSVETPYWQRVNQVTMKLAETHNLKPLATRPVMYLAGNADSTEVMSAISANNKLTDPWHTSAYVRDYHPMDEKTFLELTKTAAKSLVTTRGVTLGTFVGDAVRNQQALLDAIEYEWVKQPVSLPTMAPDEFKAVVEECKLGWKERFSDHAFGHKPTPEELRTTYKERLSYELSVLKSLNFSGYFLLVQDVVKFAKKNDILVGPGRGSVGGSLVAYLMGITDCDPIRFGLLFERFINPDRIDLPDADLDFMSARRHEIIEYLERKYGKKRVAGVSNFGTLGPSSSIRDVGRVFNLPEREYAVSKYVPKLHGQPTPLAKAVEVVPEIQNFADKYEGIWQHCLTLEGCIRNMAQHAAGVVVAGVDLVERAVIETRTDQAVVNWDKRIVEDQGLVKMDILGLSTLDLIALTLDYIKERHSKKINLLRIPLDDPKVLQNFAEAKTTGIFQFESGGMRRLLKEMASGGDITFDDVTAATALYRPGPMDSGMMDSYYLRKQGSEEIEYDHDSMMEASRDTYGVMVYQEQVMRVARDLSGYTMADADKLRKIMGKKLPEEMKKERGKFVDGAVATQGVTPELAGLIFDKIEKFAGYGFNKSHSVEYTLISMQSMWLKTYFPVEFVAAAMSLMAQDKVPTLLKEAAILGIEIIYPDINYSTDRYEILTDTKLAVPFAKLKGLSQKTTEAILEARAAGPFTSVEDLSKRVDKRRCNKKIMAILDAVGAFCSVDPTAKPQKHPDRIKDQRELLPGLVTDNVPIHRSMHADDLTRVGILEVVKEYRTKFGPEGEKDGWPARVSFPKTAKMMVISDAPSRDEEADRIGFGRNYEWVHEALIGANMERSDIYWTSLIKRVKSGSQITTKELNDYLPFLKREIEIAKPTIIVLLGTGVVRQFIPGFKGKASDAAGEVIYNPELDANMIIGFNPGEIYYAEEKQAKLNEVFSVAASLL